METIIEYECHEEKEEVDQVVVHLVCSYEIL